MKILVTGINGQLGHDVAEVLAERGHTVVGTDIAEMDITDADAVRRVMTAEHPDAVIHCAAWTAVDAAEDAENQEKVQAINVDGTAHIAALCKELNSRMMYISTDYIFDGTGETPWTPDCTDYCPLNVYGQTKLAGEQAITAVLSDYFIVRIAWVFGLNGNNFIKTMLKIGSNHDVLRVVSDQIGTPTYTEDLARLLADMIVTDRYGIYHATNEGGYISWYTFAREIFRQAAALGHPEYDEEHLRVNAVSTEEYGISKAARPYNSRLDKSKLTSCGFAPLPDWQDALHRYLKKLDL